MAILALVTGCIGDNVAEKPLLTVDRPANLDGGCTEVEVLEETEGFEPRLLPIGDHGTTWPIDLRSGESVKISIFWGGSRGGGTEIGLPDLRMADPDGELLLEETESSANHHIVPVETNGTHKITVEHPALTKGATWRIEIHWYPDVECA